MNPPHSNPQDDAAPLDALWRAARAAPLPAAADRLALGFGARAEARLRAMASEATLAERLLWRWLTGLAAGTALIVVAAGLAAGLGGGASTRDTAGPLETSSFQTEWAGYTAVPEVWPAP